MQWRILVPSASVPPSSGTPGLWRRKSGTGAVDAQGLGLTHPMTWLDERLFGWSRSSKRGTSAWGGVSNSTDASRIGSPDHSEGEDAGDYEDVIGFLPVSADQATSKPRSRQNSYADLQRLRLSALSTSSSATSPTDNGESPRRERKASLSDGVPVERIAAVDPLKQFDEATQGLNDEILMKKRKKSTP